MRELEVIEEAENIVNQIVMRDRGQVGAIVGIFAGIVELDGVESIGEAEEGRRIASIGRGETRQQEERRPFAQNTIRHPVSRAGPGLDPGLSIVAGHFASKIQRLSHRSTRRRRWRS